MSNAESDTTSYTRRVLPLNPWNFQIETFDSKDNEKRKLSKQNLQPICCFFRYLKVEWKLYRAFSLAN